MSISPEKLADLRVKHLEMIQGVITRMSGHSATLKNYCITITTAVCGFAVAVQRPGAAAIALLPILICCYLDARYLRNEKRFRHLFDQVKDGPWTEMPSFQINLGEAPHVRVRDAARSWSVAVFYGGLVGALCVVILLARYFNGKFF